MFVTASWPLSIQRRGGTFFCGHGDARLVSRHVPYEVEKLMSPAIGENSRSRDRERREKENPSVLN